MKPSTDETLAMALECIQQVKHDGGVCKIREVDGKIQTIFVSSKKMLSNLDKHQPDLMQIDTTFNTNRQKYKLVLFVYPCRHSNKTRVAAYALLADERDDCVDFTLNEFKNIYCPR